MAEKKSNAWVLLLIVAFLIFVVGGGVGVFYQQQKDAPAVNNAQKISAAMALLGSDSVPSITAYGQVSSISGNNLVLTFGGKNLSIAIDANAIVYALVKDNAGKTSTQKQVSVSDVQAGQTLSVSVKLTPTGTLIGEKLFIIPPSSVNLVSPS